MKEIKNDFIKKYQYEDYVIYIKDIKEDSKKYDSYEFYLQNEEYGVIMLMFGILKSDIEDTKGMEEIIKNNIENYIALYQEEIED